jgi:hypothetical protein
MRADFFVVGMKVQSDRDGGTILLSDNTGFGAVILLPIRFKCFGTWIPTGLPSM